MDREKEIAECARRLEAIQRRDVPAPFFSRVEPLPSPGGAGPAGWRLILWTSVESALHAIDLECDESGWRVALSAGPAGPGWPVRASERQERRRLEKLILRDLIAAGCQADLAPGADGLERLRASWPAAVDTVAAVGAPDAVAVAESMADIILSRLGMEAALQNLVTVRPNVAEADDDSTLDYIQLDDRAPADRPDAVFVTALTICVRCHGRWDDVVALTRRFPALPFRFVFLNKSRAVFKETIFSRLRPDLARGGQVAPMFFLFRAGRLAEVLGSTMQQQPPTADAVTAAIRRVYGLAPAAQ